LVNTRNITVRVAQPAVQQNEEKTNNNIMPKYDYNAMFAADDRVLDELKNFGAEGWKAIYIEDMGEKGWKLIFEKTLA
jgi:hypothetical protein